MFDEPMHPEPMKVPTSESGGDSPYTLSLGPPPGLAPPPSTSEVPSLGSALHDSGECRPCAWFWKLQGCQNGRECRHCHLCPDGEIKVRKKEKLGSLRQEMKEKLGGWRPEKQQSEEHQPQQQAEELGQDALLLSQACAPAPRPLCLPIVPPAIIPPPALPSVGSSLHGTGMCRPCAWFWKPQGCGNGLNCCHCHLCPEGEIKARRKMKAAVLRHHGAVHDPLEVQQEHLGQWDFQWGPQGQVADELYLNLLQDQYSDLSVTGETETSPSFTEGTSGSPLSPPVPLDLSASLDLLPPSTGSALHASGKCRPCTWFWKPTGCLNGQACAHCHLCPDGELKVRKKMKGAAKRIGALMPVCQGFDAGSPRIVKIAPVLEAA